MNFEKATRQKLRFASERGYMNVEDLWDLPLNTLNVMAKNLNRELKIVEEEDFLTEKSKEDVKVKLSFDIVLYIINTKKDEAKARVSLSSLKAEEDNIKDILAKKQNESLVGETEAELTKRLKDIQKKRKDIS